MNKELIERASIKAGVMEMGEHIQWGSDTAIMRELIAALRVTERKLEIAMWTLKYYAENGDVVAKAALTKIKNES